METHVIEICERPDYLALQVKDLWSRLLAGHDRLGLIMGIQAAGGPVTCYVTNFRTTDPDYSVLRDQVFWRGRTGRGTIPARQLRAKLQQEFEAFRDEFAEGTTVYTSYTSREARQEPDLWNEHLEQVTSRFDRDVTRQFRLENVPYGPYRPNPDTMSQRDPVSLENLDPDSTVYVDTNRRSLYDFDSVHGMLQQAQPKTVLGQPFEFQDVRRVNRQAVLNVLGYARSRENGGSPGAH